jgi:Holliday junction resolvasome RuvABC ATP-dependent DNA helicase subunit
MTDEELDKLVQETTVELGKISEIQEKSLDKAQRTRKAVLRLQDDILKRIKDAKKKGNLQQEAKATMDYSLLAEYGEKHPLIWWFLKTQLRWWGI